VVSEGSISKDTYDLSASAGDHSVQESIRIFLRGAKLVSIDITPSRHRSPKKVVDPSLPIEEAKDSASPLHT